MYSPSSPLFFVPFLVLILGRSVLAQPPQAELIRVTANHVVVDVRVVNGRTGQAVPGLTLDDFEIHEGGVRQEITHFSQDKLPISVVLLLDVSGSMQPVIHELHRDAFEVLRHLKPEDEVALIAYGGLAQLVQDFTKDRKLVVDKIGGVNESYIGPRSTQLSEAVYQAAVHMQHAANPASRRYVIAVTDDVSTWVRPAHTKKQALDQLLESTASLCGMTIINHESGARAGVAKIVGASMFLRLQDFAGPTGGEVLPSLLGGAAARLGDLFDGIRGRYSLGYTPSKRKMNGEFRRIRVRLKHNVRDESTGKEMTPAVIARSGYYAGRKPAVIARERNSDSVPHASTSLIVASMYGLPSAEERQMAQALFLPKETRDFETSLFPAIFLDPHGETVARISFRIHPDGIRLKRADDRYGAMFKLLAAVLNQTGMIVADYRQDYGLALDEAGYQEFLRVGTASGMTLALPPGKYQIRTVLRDSGSGKMSTLREPLKVDSLSKGLPCISSIVLSKGTVRSGETVEYGQDYDPLRLGEVAVMPSFVESYPREGSLTVFFHIYNVSEQQNPPYQYRLNLYRDEVLATSSDPLPVQSENRHPLKGYLLSRRLSLSYLSPGEYRVEVRVSLPNGSNRVSRSASFRVD